MLEVVSTSPESYSEAVKDAVGRLLATGAATKSRGDPAVTSDLPKKFLNAVTSTVTG